MAAAQKQQVVNIKQYILRGATALGNSDKEEKDVCHELLKNYVNSPKDMADVCEGTGLCYQTIERFISLEPAVTGEDYDPRSSSCARVLRFFGMEANYKAIIIKSKYRNKPKVKL